MKTPFGPARHAGFFTLGIAIAVLVIFGGVAGGATSLHSVSTDAAQSTEAAAEVDAPSIAGEADDRKVSSRGAED